MEKFRNILIFIFILITFLTLFFNSFFQITKNSFALKYLEFMKYEKQHFGGIVINKTSTSLKIVDNNRIRIIPNNKSSRDIGIFDSDLILIDKPVLFENKEYSSGIIKFCDLATMTVYEKSGITVIKPSLSYKLCKRIEGTGWFSSRRDVLNNNLKNFY